MINESDAIYRNLQKHLDKMPIGFPSAEDGSDLRVLKTFFTPEEAELATFLNFIHVTLQEIYSQTKNRGISLEETMEKLDLMVDKRLIFKEVDPKTNQISYGNLPFAIGFFETHVNHLSVEMAQASEDYGIQFIEEFMGMETGIPQMRTVPINAAISHDNIVMDYDDAHKILENIKGPYAVAPCICVQSKALIGRECKHNMLERCIVNSQNYIDRGDAREITKEEALEILKKAEDSGLVIQPGNSKDSGGFCLCCGCCCGILSYAKKLENPARLFATNFYAEIDEEFCTGCGTCANFCPMDAIIPNEVSRINKERCIGCGVCVSKCPSEAIYLKNKEQIITPPNDSIDLISRIIRKKKKTR